MTHRLAESGNVVIYVLGAIFLMGLVLMMVRGSSQPGAGIDFESMRVKVSEVQQYGGELEKAVAFILSNGYSETDIRFAHPNAASAYGDISDEPGRQVFARLGGGATWRNPPNGIQIEESPWLFSGRQVVTKVGTTCSQDTCSDLIAILHNVTRDFCLEINDLNGTTNTGGEPPIETDGIQLEQMFTGAYTYASALNADELNGKMEGCFEGSTGSEHLGLDGRYYYYRVLLPR